MKFDHYPLDTQQCPFRIGSFYSTEETVDCTAEYEFDRSMQRSLQYFTEIDLLPEKYGTIIIDSRHYAVCGINIVLNRTRMQIFFQVYLMSILFVMVSWASFIIEPDVVPGRMGVLVTTFLVLINIFNGVKSNAPKSTIMNAVDVYLIICIVHVFLAFTEYAVVLFGKRYKGKPTATLRGRKSERSSTMPSNNVGTTMYNHVQHACHVQHLSRKSLDFVSVCLFPVVFIIFNIIYCIVYI